MIKKLRLKCHSLTSSNMGYTLPAEVNNKQTHNGLAIVDQSLRNHSVDASGETNGVQLPGETSSQMVGHYDPLAGRSKILEGEGKVVMRVRGPTRLCYSDDEMGLNEGPHDLCRGIKSVSLNEESSSCCGSRRIDSFSAEEDEETHMSWIEIMSKKRELERSLKVEVVGDEFEARVLKQVVSNPDAISKSGRRKSKKTSFFSPSFKLRDFFANSSAVKTEKPRKTKNHPRLICSGQSTMGRRSSGSSNDPSPILFDLRSRGLPAIPVQDVEDFNHHHNHNNNNHHHHRRALSDDNDTGIDCHSDRLLVVGGRNSWDRELHSNRTSSSSGSGDIFIDSFNELKNKGWYWGPLSWKEAEDQLKDKPTGSFLVRDSSDDRYILSLTFKSDDKIHHTRIEHYRGQFSFNNQPKSLGAATIVEFIEKAIENCADGSFSYFLRPRGPGVPPTMFRLVRPVSRFTKVHSLQHLCRFVILSKIRRDMIEQLPVPLLIKKYLACTQYYIE